MTWPQRFPKLGSYDGAWVKERFPGFARDIDWTFFNTAPADQQLQGFFHGDEPFTLENMHPGKPVLEGRLPGLVARVFISQRTEQGEVFRELPARLETVHLFPHAERGVLLFRAVTQVAEDDGTDVLRLVVGCEQATSPRPPSHYEQVLQRRLDKEKGALAALRDQDLLPLQASTSGKPANEAADAADLARERLLEKNLRRRAERELAQSREGLRQQGLDPDQYLPASLPPEPEPVKPDEIGNVMQSGMETLETAQKEAELRRQAADKEARQQCEKLGLDYDQLVARNQAGAGGPPTFSAQGELTRLRDIAAQLRALGTPASGLEARLADPALETQLREAEAALLLNYQHAAHFQPPASPMSAERAAQVREQVLLLRQHSASLAGRDLTGADLSHMDLRGASLQGALLERADFRGADLRGADFSGAVLAHADLSDADLSGTNFTGVNLGRARLVRVRMTEPAIFSRAVLHGADLSDAALTNARMDGVDLYDAVLAGADLRGADLRELTLVRTRMTGTRLAGADLSRANLLDVELSGVDLSGATLLRTVFVNCRAEGASFRDAKMDNLRVVGDSAFRRVDFSGASLRGANLRATDLSEGDFRCAQLHGAELSECNLQNARLDGALAVEARLVRADLTGASLVSANLMQSILQKACIQGADLRKANLFRADFARIRGSARSTEGAYLKQVRIHPRNPHE